MGNSISKSTFNECFKHWKCLMFSFLWSESWTSYAESIGTSELNWFLNLVLKQPWEHTTLSMISWGSTNLMLPIPKKCSYLLSRNATCSVSFGWHLQHITLRSFHRNMFFLFGQEVAFPSVVSHKKICRFMFPWNDIHLYRPNIWSAKI